MNKMRSEEIEIVNVEDDKYSLEVEIIDVKDFDIQKITANVIINIKGNKLKCFVSDFEEKGTFFVGEKYNVMLSLLPTVLTETSEIKKEIKNVERYEEYCYLSGKLVEFVPLIEFYCEVKKGSNYIKKDYHYKYVIVDCGIFVAVKIPKGSNLKIGDYIKAVGRLDIRKVKE